MENVSDSSPTGQRLQADLGIGVSKERDLETLCELNREKEHGFLLPGRIFVVEIEFEIQQHFLQVFNGVMKSEFQVRKCSGDVASQMLVQRFLNEGMNELWHNSLVVLIISSGVERIIS